MVRLVIRCQYTGHYVFTRIQMRPDTAIAGARIFCPYCATDHVWSCDEARFEERRKPLVAARELKSVESNSALAQSLVPQGAQASAYSPAPIFRRSVPLPSRPFLE